MTPDGQSPFTAEEAAALARFTANSGLSLEQLANMGLKGIAAYLLSNNGQISLPIKIGPPSPVCHTCPVSNNVQQPAYVAPQPNVVNFPRH